MDRKKFTKMKRLISKLTAAANKAVKKNKNFEKYPEQTLTALHDTPHSLKHLDSRFGTANVVE